MPISHALTEQAAAAGMTVPELVQQAFEQHGTEHKAAVALGVYANTIRWHLGKRQAQKKSARRKSKK